MSRRLSTDDVLIVVPARGGSKGIPRKNLRSFRGKPLIRHTFDLLQNLPEFTHVLVSTEDKEIQDYCASQGFGTDYARPDELAADDTPIAEVLIHAYEWTRTSTGRDFSFIMLMQPTSPLRKPQHVRSFTAKLLDTPTTSLVSVSPMTQHPMECLVAGESGPSWEYLVKPPPGAPGRQAYSKNFYFINGALYGAGPDFLKREKSFLIPGVTDLFLMGKEFALDIDDPEDLNR